MEPAPQVAHLHALQIRDYISNAGEVFAHLHALQIRDYISNAREVFVR